MKRINQQREQEALLVAQREQELREQEQAAQEKEEFSPKPVFRQLIEEMCGTKVCEEKKQNMEDTMLDLLEDCRQKELYCIHNNVDDLIKSALNSKLLLINLNSQRFDKEKQEVKNISLSMGDEHLSTISETESDELIKSSVENLVPTPSEFEDISEDTYDVPVCDDSSIFDALSDHSEILSVSNNDDTLSDGNDFEDIEYVSLEEIEPDQGGLTSVISDNSNNSLLELPEFESFYFDPSFPRPHPEPPDVEICFNFEPDAPMINNFDALNEVECFYLEGGEINVSQNAEDDDSFALVIRTFLPFLTYHVDSPLLLSIGSEDTIFDPGIFT
ncbi:hypothetical protein Tco_0992257 [Tanacetum coccineum]|uniref:Uncharacterized protein n=1 Tax=Tanacetum coccineum TaxID=301880 RepID=A0ABQ5F299_9ASTR